MCGILAKIKQKQIMEVAENFETSAVSGPTQENKHIVAVMCVVIGTVLGYIPIKLRAYRDSCVLPNTKKAMANLCAVFDVCSAAYFALHGIYFLFSDEGPMLFKSIFAGTCAFAAFLQWKSAINSEEILAEKICP